MADLTPLQQAEAYLEITSPADPDEWVAKAQDLTYGRERLVALTFRTLRALVDQIHLDAERLKQYAEEIAEMKEEVDEW
jgi:hypothetical protein